MDMTQRKNMNHPEARPGEMWIQNIVQPGMEFHDRDWEWAQEVFPSSRMGVQSFNSFDDPIKNAVPVFISVAEWKSKGFGK
jgi:hypothetical protein